MSTPQKLFVMCCALIFIKEGGKSLPVMGLRPFKLTVKTYLYTDSSWHLDLMLPL